MSKILMIGDLNPASCQSATMQFLSMAEGCSRHATRVDVVTQRLRKHPPVIELKPKNLHLHARLPRHSFRWWQHIRLVLLALRRRYQLIYLRYPQVPMNVLWLLRLVSSGKVVVHQARFEIAAKPSRSRLVTRWRLNRQLRLARKAHGVHVSTQALASLLIAHDIDDRKILLINNGSQLSKIYPLAHDASFKRFNLDPDFVYLGFVGTLNDRQDVTTALKALALLKDKNPLVKFIIAGEGPALASLQAEAEALGVIDQTIFFGAIAYQDLNALLNTFDVALAPFTLAHTADAGLCPLKLRDYAAAGLPTVVADVPGIRDEQYEANWLHAYPPEDAETLAQLLLNLVEQGVERINMRHTAREYAQQHFDWKHLSKELITQSQRVGRKPQRSLTTHSLLEK